MAIRSCSTRNGEEAIQISEQHAGTIHLLLTDVVMPKLGGRQLADCLAESRPTMKVLYMSGYTDDQLIRQGVEKAATHFLAKPFAPVALTGKVREVLNAVCVIGN